MVGYMLVIVLSGLLILSLYLAKKEKREYEQRIARFIKTQKELVDEIKRLKSLNNK